MFSTQLKAPDGFFEYNCSSNTNMEPVDWHHVLKVSKDDCEEPQKEFANRAVLIEVEFTNFLEQIQQKTEQVSSEPPTSATDNAASRKMKLDNTSEEEDCSETVNREELATFLEQFEQESKRVASQLSESNLCPSPKRMKVSDCQPSTSQSTAGSFCVPSATNYIVTRATNTNAWDKPYIKRPPNAFMLFRAAHRKKVADELGITVSAQINRELGRRWNMLSEEERAPYFEQALMEKKAHQAMFPGWSVKDNFGKNFSRKKGSCAPSHNYLGFPAPMMGPNASVPTATLLRPPYNQVPYYQAWGPSSQAPYSQALGPNRQALDNKARAKHKAPNN